MQSPDAKRSFQTLSLNLFPLSVTNSTKTCVTGACFRVIKQQSPESLINPVSSKFLIIHRKDIEFAIVFFPRLESKKDCEIHFSKAFYIVLSAYLPSQRIMGMRRSREPVFVSSHRLPLMIARYNCQMLINKQIFISRSF